MEKIEVKNGIDAILEKIQQERDSAISIISDFLRENTNGKTEPPTREEIAGLLETAFKAFSLTAKSYTAKQLREIAEQMEKEGTNIELNAAEGNAAIEMILNELSQYCDHSELRNTIKKAFSAYCISSPMMSARRLLDSLTKEEREALQQVFSPNFYNMPDSTASNLILDTLGAGTSIADLPKRKKAVSHGSNIQVLERGKERRIELNSGKAQVTIELSDIDKMAGSNKTAKKMFVLALIKANEQAIHNGELTRNYVSFPLQELVRIGFYKTPQSARKGFKSGMDTLTSLKVKGKLQKGKKKSTTIEALEVLFTGARITKGQCIIYFNDRISWNFLAQYFTIIPVYYFELSNRASDLLYYIFYLARQHTKDIQERGYFTISFRSLQARLNLPSEIGNTNPYRTIKQPIEEAIEEIETAHSGYYNSTELALLPVYDDLAPISDFLDTGYLKVTLSGDFSRTFIELSKKQTKQIAAAEKRKNAIIDQAKAIATANKIEADSGKE